MEVTEVDGRLKQAIAELTENARDLVVPRMISYVECPKEDLGAILEFHRNFVSTNTPCVITGAVDNWPARRLWNPEYLREKIGQENVTVDLTRKGNNADSVIDGKFVTPWTEKMKFCTFVDCLRNKRSEKYGESAQFYLQNQNDNLRREFQSLWDDIELEPQWIRGLLGQKSPDAVNFWMGNSESMSSIHKDHYENFYVVMSGCKHFLLFPPTDLVHMKPKKFKKASFKLNPQISELEIFEEEDAGEIIWISVDPSNKSIQDLCAGPVKVTLRPGEMLYLPSMWLHQVWQEDLTIAVNYWYDMNFGLNYAWFQFYERLIREQESIESLSSVSRSSS